MRAVARRREGLAHVVEIDGHEIAVDEPVEAGGTDTAPSPTRLLTASLAACTAITVAMYAERKGWELDGLAVEADFAGPPRAGETARFEVAVALPGHLDAEQRRRIMVIAGKCPVHRILAGDTEIVVTERR
ncbi:MAG: OsmC family peroxiredoxin [Acidobacteria bacterium]|nr:MAG: OsmC family peroxiredoxin [Acidobacteriota bacterium]MCL4287545.1 OsmC family protein [Thermoleophilia bacterium]